MTYTRQFRDSSYRNAIFTNGYSFKPGSIFDMTVTGSRTGVKVENWKEKIRLGQNASSPYTSDRSRVIYGEPLDFQLAVRQRDAPYTLYANRIAGHPHAIGVNPMIDHLVNVNKTLAGNDAIGKTYKKLAQEQQHMNSPAVIAEFLDVIRQFGKPAEALVDLTNRRLNRLELERRGLKGSTSFKKIRYAEIVASTWLEYSFGLAPLISDTKAAAETLARWQLEKTNPELIRLRKKIQSRGSSEASSTGTYLWDISPVSSSPGQTCSEVTKTEYRVQYTVGLQGEISADYGSNERLLQLLGFDHANWIPAIWEAVPWSWLVDYFTNVQQILEASVTNTSRVAWVSRSVTTKTSKIFTPKLSPELIIKTYANSVNAHPVSPYTLKGTGSMEIIRTSLVRDVPTFLTVPPLIVKHPFDKAKKVANMVAVLFKRKGNSALWIT